MAKSVDRERRERILLAAPIHKQIEAIRDHIDGKPEKYSGQKKAIEDIKKTLPKV
ncbi:MAG: hypothetical protein HQL93_04150 [Magnetococcales bacterium]|nr:hypothetical protein [Magnetococcales bacterium]